MKLVTKMFALQLLHKSNAEQLMNRLATMKHATKINAELFQVNNNAES